MSNYDPSYLDVLRHGITERGNTALINHENGSSLFYTKIEENQWLEISMCLDNYPAWNISIMDKSTSEIRQHIEENLSEQWQFQKNNIGANAVDNRPVDIGYVMERVRDHLYVYRDNKNFETKDTVTTIHAFLESKEWTLDIAIIEKLRQEFDDVTTAEY